MVMRTGMVGMSTTEMGRAASRPDWAPEVAHRVYIGVSAP